VAIQPSRVDFQWLLSERTPRVDVDAETVEPCLVTTKGFFFKQQDETRNFFVQPSTGIFGTKMNQYDQLIKQTQTGSKAAVDKVA